MSELTRKQRYIGMCRQLLKVAIEQKDLRYGSSLARLVARLEGWDASPEPPADTTPQNPVDLTGLLQHITTPGESNGS